MDECYGAVVPAAWTGWDDKGVKPTRSDGACHDLDPDPLHRLGVMRDALNASGAAVCVPACLYVCSSTYACLPAWGLPATAALGTRPFCALPATKWCPNCRHLPDKCPGNNPPAHRPDPTRPPDRRAADLLFERIPGGARKLPRRKVQLHLDGADPRPADAGPCQHVADLPRHRPVRSPVGARLVDPWDLRLRTPCEPAFRPPAQKLPVLILSRVAIGGCALPPAAQELEEHPEQHGFRRALGQVRWTGLDQRPGPRVPPPARVPAGGPGLLARRTRPCLPPRCFRRVRVRESPRPCPTHPPAPRRPHPPLPLPSTQDMLQVGNGMSFEQDLSHFTMCKKSSLIVWLVGRSCKPCNRSC